MNRELKIYDCDLIQLPKINAASGSLTIVDNEGGILPFEVKRVFYLYDIPAAKSRGAHAHKECHQLLIALSGAFEVLLDDGQAKRTVFINQPFLGLHIPPGIWASEQNFSSGSICLVLTSEEFDEEDYIREYEEFLSFKGIEK
ncbi:FdtA/QdtA family cupin domain-containing protein [Mesonia ostreae]|uniref:FdtA/QdtA family cupin domain-containing protein n=1 Tax=Mesonia ostreae TaxID=861110 RepID=A0ABU2KM09_9FLAO|nr:FdtA/QdtA family cupin domain-containing protein [Mesonia ostreae]MDT0295755.1 FdtA/QdtA family cupin domain-containing protein [Mesonia ostreae]